jgi:hypothetical protein
MGTLMANLSDADLAAATFIAIALILIVLFVWPGVLRVRPHALAGYWYSQKTNALFEIRPIEGRAFIILTGAGNAQGALRGTRGVRAVFPGEDAARAGYIDVGGRRIVWENDIWTLQGIR